MNRLSSSGIYQTVTRILDAEEAPKSNFSVQSYQLKMVEGPSVGETWPLGSTAQLGKGPDNTIIVMDATVSRSHLEIEETDNGLRVKDLNSTNGTFLDGARIMEAFASPGMEIRAGDVVFRLIAVHEDVNIVPSGESVFKNLVGSTDQMRRIFSLLEKISPTDATVLITGETGCGKSAVAKSIHNASNRKNKPFVVVDCGSISTNLIESELFGHERGAFTGATQLRRGALETCAGGTLFIDELDDLPLDVQPKLLRAIDEREIYRVGSIKPIKLDLRIIAATKKDLVKEVEIGRFREDLYYRLSIVTFRLPPLRERLADIPVLADNFLKDKEKRFSDLSTTLQRRLKEHHYPGNVRELRNLLERALYLDGIDEIDPTTFPTSSTSSDAMAAVSHSGIDYDQPFKVAKEVVVDRFEKAYIAKLIPRCGGNISKAAREAGIDRKYLYMLMNKHNLQP